MLLELDLEQLKTEIGIPAFGKRKRIANAITELKKSVEPEPGAHSESFFSHSRRLSSTQGSPFNNISLLSSVPPVSTTGPPTPGGFYFSGSPDGNSLPPDTPRSTRPRRESDTGSIQENVEVLNRTSSRNSFIGLGIQLTSKFQVMAVQYEVQGEILMAIFLHHRKADHRSSICRLVTEIWAGRILSLWIMLSPLTMIEQP